MYSPYRKKWASIAVFGWSGFCSRSLGLCCGKCGRERFDEWIADGLHDLARSRGQRTWRRPLPSRWEWRLRWAIFGLMLFNSFAVSAMDKKGRQLGRTQSADGAAFFLALSDKHLHLAAFKRTGDPGFFGQSDDAASIRSCGKVPERLDGLVMLVFGDSRKVMSANSSITRFG